LKGSAVLPRLMLWLLRIAVILTLAYALYALSAWVMAQTQTLGNGPQLRVGLLVLLLLAYALLIAVPFVPGIEIGLSLLMLGGALTYLTAKAASLANKTMAAMSHKP